MKVIYVSSLVSKNKMNYIINNSKKKPLQSVQKYHRLICEGLAQNDVKVKTLSAIPMSSQISNKKMWFEKKEEENGVLYKYIPFINIRIIRQIFLFIFSLLSIMKECICNKKDKVFICDMLNTTIATTALSVCKLFRVKCIAIVTDLPKDIGGKYSVSKKVNQFCQSKYDAYILVTEYMNDVVNKDKKRPYIVIEGLTDVYLIDDKSYNKYSNKVCMYAGGLYEKYGVKALIEAILLIEIDDLELHLYGSGELEDYIKNINNKKIVYKGVATNDKIIEEERKVTLLINPRFTGEDYTKYSFPSKNIEYMSSGTPVLTTRLAGIPEEYYKYIYCFEGENIEDYANKITKILHKDNEELTTKGEKAKEFVLKNKNNIVQTKEIIKWLPTI